MEPFYKRREEKKRETPVAPFDGDGTGPQAGADHEAASLLSDDEARELQEAFDAVLDAARDIGIPQTSADVRKANALVADYSAAWVLEAVRRAGTGPASARSWRYVEGILRKWRAAGGMDAEQAKARAAVPDIAEVGFE